MLCNWFVGEDGIHYYGDNEDEIREENCLSEDFKFIPTGKWKLENYVEIFGNELEDRNRHSLVEMPKWLLDVLNKTTVATVDKKTIMREFMIKVLDEI